MGLDVQLEITITMVTWIFTLPTSALMPITKITEMAPSQMFQHEPVWLINSGEPVVLLATLIMMTYWISILPIMLNIISSRTENVKNGVYGFVYGLIVGHVPIHLTPMYATETTEMELSPILSSQSGILDIAAGHELGVTFSDYDNDGAQDLYIANDRDPNFLFRNRGDGVFEEVALMLGVAYHVWKTKKLAWELLLVTTTTTVCST